MKKIITQNSVYIIDKGILFSANNLDKAKIVVAISVNFRSCIMIKAHLTTDPEQILKNRELLIAHLIKENFIGNVITVGERLVIVLTEDSAQNYSRVGMVTSTIQKIECINPTNSENTNFIQQPRKIIES